jgi:hypothetical protein
LEVGHRPLAVFLHAGVARPEALNHERYVSMSSHKGGTPSSLGVSSGVTSKPSVSSVSGSVGLCRSEEL